MTVKRAIRPIPRLIAAAAFFTAAMVGAASCATAPDAGTDVKQFDGNYNGSALNGGVAINISMVASNGSIVIAASPTSVFTGTISAAGVISATGGASPGCSASTFGGQATVSSSGVASAAGTWSQPAIPGGATDCVGAGTWHVTR